MSVKLTINLFLQGLTSSDHKMQKEIFLKRDPAIISSTVAELPVHCVVAMVQELVVLVHWRGWRYDIMMLIFTCF